MSNRLSELWMTFGTGDTSRFIPLHFIASQIGQIVCSVIIKAHTLTGSDVTSKIGTKAAALKCTPENYLITFGEIDEQYLVKAMHTNTTCITFDEFH